MFYGHGHIAWKMWCKFPVQWDTPPSSTGVYESWLNIRLVTKDTKTIWMNNCKESGIHHHSINVYIYIWLYVWKCRCTNLHVYYISCLSHLNKITMDIFTISNHPLGLSLKPNIVFKTWFTSSIQIIQIHPPQTAKRHLALHPSGLPNNFPHCRKGVGNPPSWQHGVAVKDFARRDATLRWNWDVQLALMMTSLYSEKSSKFC